MIAHSLAIAAAAFRAPGHSDELEECPNDTPGFRMSKSADKSSYSGIYIALNLFPDTNPLVCEFLKVIRFELAVWITADATRMPVRRAESRVRPEMSNGMKGKGPLKREGPMMCVMDTCSYQSLLYTCHAPIFLFFPL